MKMPLHRLGRGEIFRCVGPVEVPPAHRPISTEEVLEFDHIDGMYSLCYDRKRKPVHPSANQEVDVIQRVCIP